MEKVSPPSSQQLTPLTSHNNKNNMTEISSTHTMKLKSLKELGNEEKSAVTGEVPSRANFKRSNTCGSFFANCQCREHQKSSIAVPFIATETVCDSKSSVTTKTIRTVPKIRKNLSFTHPDTPVIFTEENRYPDLSARRPSREIFLDDGNQKIEIKHSKRASSPNLRTTNYDVCIHPEFQIQVVPKSPTLHDLNSTPTHHRKPLLKKNSKSFPSVSSSTATRSSSFRSFDSDGTFSSYSVDEENEESELSEKVSELLTTDLDKSSTSFSSSQSSTTTVEHQKQQSRQSPTNNTAEKFFQESGILGVCGMGNVSSILKKSSKIKPILNDSHTKKQIRKTSLVLFGGHPKEDRKRSISESYDCHPEFLRPLSLQDEIRELKLTIKTRDAEIENLRHEIHKLKSVLQQQATSNLKCECHFSSPQAILWTITEPSYDENNQQPEKSSETSSHASVLTQSHQQQQKLRNDKDLNCSNNISQVVSKKQGVSGESCDTKVIGSSSDILIRKYEKDFKSKQLIKDAVLENDFLKHLDCVQIRELVESMYCRDVDLGEFVVRENEPGNHLFVSADGEFEIIVNGKTLGTLQAGKAFGELAILYNCRRTASIRAIKPSSRVWVLDRRAFQQIMMRTGLQRIEENVKFLRCVPLLQTLDDDILCKIADVLELEFYPADAHIIRQGAIGDTFFLISQGNVRVTQKLPGRMHEEEIRVLGRGDYFGEQSLIKEDKRSANIIAMAPGVECLTLDRGAFKQLIGNLEELHSIDYGDRDRLMKRNIDNQRRKLIQDNERSLKEYDDIEFKQLKSVAVVGVGGFGRVVIVKHGKDDNFKVFALKQMKKAHIVETKQEEHVFNERRIMMSLSSPFICRLFKTFRDKKFIYLLLEACMGGEVWTLLRNQGRFSESTAKFIVGCVLEAFEYLHIRGIIYRDLKPENLMINSNGYVKLVDFGFAKQIGFSSKTWTFCGTPEYVAPEIILNKGHDKSVDYWALGILISELITGAPPFRSDDPLKTYNIILKGIDVIEYPRYVSRAAISLIKKLCRDWPSDRLGYQRNGIADIRNHKWYQGFDWESLANLTLKPPRISAAVNGALDLRNFDKFSNDCEIPPDETSGWDEDF